MTVRGFFNLLRIFLESFYNLVFPQTCLSCSRSYATSGEFFCSHCLQKLMRTEPQYKNLVPNAEQAWSLFPYKMVKKAIHLLKFADFTALGDYFAKFAVSFLQKQNLRFDVVVAVPLHRTRKRERGYNQSALFGQAIAGGLGIKFWKNALKRVRYTVPQVRLSGRERRKNLAAAFQTEKNFSGKRVLLVDDVLTTGTTLNAVAAVLKAAKAKEIFVLTIGGV